ncbi:dihydroxyacetone kinase subunit M [Escherichia coli]|nr:dihydroxyacetone kinase subunit M [Escherichia coli]
MLHLLCVPFRLFRVKPFIINRFLCTVQAKSTLTVEEEQERLRQAIDFTLLDLMTLTAKAEAIGLDDIARNLFWSPYTVR